MQGPQVRSRSIISSWEKGKLLGRGSFGSVYEGIADGGVFIAVKEVSLLDQGVQGRPSISQLEQEIDLLSKFEHENIVQYLGSEKAAKLNDVQSCKGHTFWMAPEVVKRSQGYGLAANIWSLGCTVLELLIGRLPYHPLDGDARGKSNQSQSRKAVVPVTGSARPSRAYASRAYGDHQVHRRQIRVK